MNEEKFLVQFVPSKNCFLQFSNKWFQKINNSKCFCLKLFHTETKREFYFSLAPQPSFGINDCYVGINATFANGFKLHENDLVVVSSEDKIVSLTRVFLSPFSADDYELLEISKDNVEESLLNQIRVINKSQILTVWVSKTVHLRLVVEQISPEATYGRIEQITEVVIDNTSKTGDGVIENTTNSNANIVQDRSYRNEQNSNYSIWSLLSQFVSFLEPNPQTVCKPNYSKDRNMLTYRVYPFAAHSTDVSCCQTPHNELIHPFHVFVFRDALKRDKCKSSDPSLIELFKSDKSAVLCRIESVPLIRPRSMKSKDNKKTVNSCADNEDNGLYVRLYRIEESCEFFKKTRTNVAGVFVSQFLQKLLNCHVGSKVRLTAFRPNPGKILTSIKLKTSTKMNYDEANKLIEEFPKWLPGREGVLVNNYYPLPFNPHVQIHLEPPDLPCWPVTVPQLENCPVTVYPQSNPTLARFDNKLDNTKSSYKVTNSVFKELVEEAERALIFGLELHEDHYQDTFLNNVLITGKRGSGKSRLVEAVSSRISGSPHYVHVNVIACKTLKGKNPDTISKLVSEALAECVYYEPSVLVLEDLETIAGVQSSEIQPTAEGSYFLRVASILQENLWAHKSVRVLATSESRQLISQQLLAARGRHMFSTFLDIPQLDKKTRIKLLKDLVEARVGGALLLKSFMEQMGDKTEGCVARDLYRLVDRAIFNACKHSIQEVRMTGNDMEAALQGFIPEHLANVSLTHHSNVSFSHVGGLDNAKQLITQLLIWPTKYPEVFRQCPLKLGRGVLLYGAPGTGKTLLATAVAGECGLNFITVKGPELLSKYIGASEEAVRNLFLKAQSAQPCILFFDEFDSLAPRRGHDSTGVTDRVVNQLLTQLDGVEALEGVWIVAAASRPDLLDPALLRPGRIGSLIHCNLPSQNERLAILQCISGNVQLSDDTDLAEIAAQTEGFTGADLQAILFTAQMVAYDAIQPDIEDVQNQLSPETNVKVSQAHLLTALKDTSASLKPKEREKFEKIYELFRNDRETGESISKIPSQRVTLA